MSHVSIASTAHRELCERAESAERHYGCPCGMLIIGPIDGDSRCPNGVEEAQLLDQLYGPPQRWTFDIVPLKGLETFAVGPSDVVYREVIGGVPVVVLTKEAVPNLSVELEGDRIRVREVDA